jgi:hypothetical protein
MPKPMAPKDGAPFEYPCRLAMERERECSRQRLDGSALRYACCNASAAFGTGPLQVNSRSYNSCLSRRPACHLRQPRIKFWQQNDAVLIATR